MGKQQQVPGPLAATLATVRDHVVDRRPDWFPDRAEAEVGLEVLSDRARCVLVTVHLDGDPRPVALAKIRRDVSSPPGDADRPRLRSDVVAAAEMTVLEFEGLRAIAATADQDPAFGAVEPLALLADEATLVMRFVSAPTLRDVVVGESRLRRRRTDVAMSATTGCEVAGRWLRSFQQRMPAGHLPVRQGSRDDVVAMFGRYGDFLADTASGSGWKTIARRGAELADLVLPVELPLAVGHGDFAPRNMFVDGERLSIFDPMPRWQVPTYEDVCRFVVGLRLLGEQVHTHGKAFDRGRLDALEGAVVDGYVGADDELRAPLRCYQLLILLDKWSALRSARGSGLTARLTHRSTGWATGFVRSEAERAIALVEQSDH